MFITFEGPEGCGKSTHSKRLKNYLEGKGHEVILTHEPGGTQLGKHIRELLLDPESVLSENTEVYLFAADRSEHVNKIILPALKQGKIVISDRFTDSTLAYQIGGRGLPEDLVRYICMISSKGLIPDLTILLDVSPERGIKRVTELGSLDRFEKEKIEFHKKVREKYLEIAKGDTERIKIINTEGKEIDEVQEKIRKMVEKVLNEKR
ncbi:MAG: dTMP kinase [Candidatus Margulisiibacteriota bacterium]